MYNHMHCWAKGLALQCLSLHSVACAPQTIEDLQLEAVYYYLKNILVVSSHAFITVSPVIQLAQLTLSPNEGR